MRTSLALRSSLRASERAPGAIWMAMAMCARRSRSHDLQCIPASLPASCLPEDATDRYIPPQLDLVTADSDAMRYPYHMMDASMTTTTSYRPLIYLNGGYFWGESDPNLIGVLNPQAFLNYWDYYSYTTDQDASDDEDSSGGMGGGMMGRRLGSQGSRRSLFGGMMPGGSTSTDDTSPGKIPNIQGITVVSLADFDGDGDLECACVGVQTRGQPSSCWMY